MKKKLFIIMFTCIALILTAMPMLSASEACGSYTIVDAVEILCHLAELPNNAQTLKHDMNRNETLDIEDAVIILCYLAKLSPLPDCNCIEDEPLSVRLLALDTTEWETHSSDAIHITGNGRYPVTLEIDPSRTTLSQLVLRTDGASFAWPNDFVGLTPASVKWWGASIAIENITINGNAFGNTIGDHSLVKMWGDANRDYADLDQVDVEIWNGWYSPNQHITGISVVEVDIDGETVNTFGLPGNAKITTITLDIVISGISEVHTFPPTTPREHGVISADLTAHGLVENMGAGWNLGNTFDPYMVNRALPAGWGYNLNISQLEMLWISGVENLTSKELIDGVKAAGFDTIRIPVSWHKVADPNRNWQICKDWLDRVQQVVDWAYNNDMYIIINSHHDESIMLLRDEDRETALNTIGRIWEQIAVRFKDYDEKLIFEGLNEPRVMDEPCTHSNCPTPRKGCQQVEWNWGDGAPNEYFANLNALNQRFVDSVRSVGGNNQHRILMMPTYGAGASVSSLNAFALPADPSNSVNKLALSVHAYEPFEFAINSTTANWTEQEVITVLERISNRGKALGVPVILGEWGVTNNDRISDSASEREAGRAAYAEFYVREATRLGMRTVIWDNGAPVTQIGREAFAFINRRTGGMYFPEIISALLTALPVKLFSGNS